MILPNHDFRSLLESMIADAADTLHANILHHSDDACDYANGAFHLLAIINDIIPNLNDLLFDELDDAQRVRISNFLTDMINCRPLDDNNLECIHSIACDAWPQTPLLIDFDHCPNYCSDSCMTCPTTEGN